jgi:hypothetical protein
MPGSDKLGAAEEDVDAELLEAMVVVSDDKIVLLTDSGDGGSDPASSGGIGATCLMMSVARIDSVERRMF